MEAKKIFGWGSKTPERQREREIYIYI